MSRVILSIQGRQEYEGQEPEVIEMVTEGTMDYRQGGWDIRYEETALTGLEGVTTSFRVEPERVILKRTGALESEMIFQEGKPHDSLYQLPFGALLMTIQTQWIRANLTEKGGEVSLLYKIFIENSDAGIIKYHLEVRPAE